MFARGPPGGQRRRRAWVAPARSRSARGPRAHGRRARGRRAAPPGRPVRRPAV